MGYTEREVRTIPMPYGINISCESKKYMIIGENDNKFGLYIQKELRFICRSVEHEEELLDLFKSYLNEL